MSLGTVIVFTDRPSNCDALCAILDTAATCRIVGTHEAWWQSETVIGLIADFSLNTAQNRTCLQSLLRRAKCGTPLVVLAPYCFDITSYMPALPGSATSLPRNADPRTIVASLFQQIDPDRPIIDIVVDRSVAKTGDLLAGMFKSAKNGKIVLADVEEGLEPIMTAVQDGGLTRWLDIVWRYDDITFQHCLLVAGITVNFAKYLGLSHDDCIRLARAALVHDVGKAQIPLAILNKPGRLDADEMDVMRTHAPLGHAILKQSGECDPLTLSITRHHHEMMDGTGYPDALSSSEISDPIRMLTVCDIYAALIERRPYKAPMASADALEILINMKGKLENGIVDAFARSIVCSSAPINLAA